MATMSHHSDSVTPLSHLNLKHHPSQLSQGSIIPKMVFLLFWDSSDVISISWMPTFLKWSSVVVGF